MRGSINCLDADVTDRIDDRGETVRERAADEGDCGGRPKNNHSLPVRSY